MTGKVIVANEPLRMRTDTSGHQQTRRNLPALKRTALDGLLAELPRSEGKCVTSHRPKSFHFHPVPVNVDGGVSVPANRRGNHTA